MKTLMKISTIALTMLSFASKSYATDFTISLVPAASSVGDNQITVISVSKVSGLQSALDAKSNSADVSAALAQKADQSSVTSALSSKADQSSVTASLALKANTSSLGSLATKSSVSDSDITSVSSSKVTGLQTALDAKADQTALTSGLAAKANSSSLGTLATKSSLAISDITGLQAALDSKASSATAAVDQTGAVFAFAGPCPSWTLEADGSSLSRTGYPKLFAAIGTAHGTANASSFNIPDYRGRFLRGTDGTAGRDADKATRTAMNAGATNTGNTVGSVQSDSFASHTHIQNAHSHEEVTAHPSNTGGGPYPFGMAGVAWTYNSGISTNPTTATNQNAGGSETRPKNANVNYCIVF